MTQVSLLDSDRLSGLLRDALPWSDNVSSLLVSATNGSILAYAYRNATPSIKAMRTQSTTMTAAYTVASENILVFEAQNMGAISVITPIADHVLLAVTGPEPKQPAALEMGQPEEGEHAMNGTDEGPADVEEHDSEDSHQQIRTDLEEVSQELAGMLRAELSAMKWPDDI